MQIIIHASSIYFLWTYLIMQEMWGVQSNWGVCKDMSRAKAATKSKVAKHQEEQPEGALAAPSLQEEGEGVVAPAQRGMELSCSPMCWCLEQQQARKPSQCRAQNRMETGESSLWLATGEFSAYIPYFNFEILTKIIVIDNTKYSKYLKLVIE